ncbi:MULTISPECIES: hypothetical protein [Mycolicibacterium]|uniref:PE domain-containing protein n=1 Tax=Mycolicibacterium porcinum TaxID=39693 RepID=A0ABV3VFR4_9MYCO
MPGLNLEVAGATSAFSAAAAVLGLPPSAPLAGASLYGLITLIDLNAAAAHDAASSAAAEADQAGAGATGIDNVTTYVGTDTNNAAALGDSGAATVAV